MPKKMTTLNKFFYAAVLVAGGAGLSFAVNAQSVLTDLHKSNEMEIQMGRIAQVKGQSPEIRSLGEKVAKDHAAADKKVTEIAQKQGVRLNEAGYMEKQWDEREIHALTEKSGAEFDQAFAKEMVEDHQKDIAKLEKAQTSLGSTPTGTLIAELLPTLHDHLDMAQKLARQS